MHTRRERNAKLIKKKKESVLKATGKLACEGCGFDFMRFYGPLGDGFIECHHRRALSTLVESKNTKLDDLAMVCANCHRMLHRIRPWKTIEELQILINSQCVGY
ncbi:HNH endonuclease [Undibacterium sp. TC4M20W]|uniref:HNH endonuclease n=1 Tax=Undibacterium sp. TC4M20W TaxID=3413052 RepID=UPI003BEFE43D